MKSVQTQTFENNPMLHSTSSMLTFEEACNYLKVSKSFLYKATSERTIPFYKPTGGKLIRFHKDDLDKWLSQNRHTSKNEISNNLCKGGKS